MIPILYHKFIFLSRLYIFDLEPSRVLVLIKVGVNHAPRRFDEAQNKKGMRCIPLYENQQSCIPRRAACEQAPRRLSAGMRTRCAYAPRRFDEATKQKRDAMHPFVRESAYGCIFPPSRCIASVHRAFGGNANSLRLRASSFRRGNKTKKGCDASLFCFGDPYENRTRVTAVKGRCLSRLTNGPYKASDRFSSKALVAEIGLEPMTYRV